MEGMTSSVTSDGGLVQCSVVSRIHQYYELLVVCIGVAHDNIAYYTCKVLYIL